MEQVYALIWKLGIRSNYKGYRQLAMVLQIAKNSNAYPLLVTKLLYPEVAKAFNVTPSSIERNLRTIIAVCWERGNRSFLEEIASYRIIIKPTTKEFIEILVEYLQKH